MPGGRGVCCHNHDCAEADCGPQYSLYKHIDISKVICLNEAQEGSCRRVFKPWHQRTEWVEGEILESHDDDPELLLHIPFDGAVKLKAVCVVGGTDGTSPGKMRLFINREDLDFATVGEMPAVQEFDLVENDAGEIEYQTHVVKFQGVHHLCIHFPESLGADQTRISFVGLKGEHVERKREAVEAVYESKPIPKGTDVPQPHGNLWGQESGR